ncbi:MAG: type II toxin-antitoxin system HicB family antitoxin [Deltaproteobacteria bacterium]|nr:type II toxin-antitoxin system HicB family antitoxin [Deltaproteobacteria bacterium]
MKKFLIVVEKTKSGYSAYSPDLPGCVATAKSRVSVTKRMKEAIKFHLEGLYEEGEKIPRPHSYSTYLSVAA